DIEHTYTSVVVGRKDDFFAVKAARPVFVQVVWTESAERAEVSLFRRGQGGDGHRVFRSADIDNECIKRAFGAHLRVCFIGRNHQVAARQGQSGVRASWERRRPVDV